MCKHDEHFPGPQIKVPFKFTKRVNFFFLFFFFLFFPFESCVIELLVRRLNESPMHFVENQ